MRGMIARELIENDGAKSYSSEPVERPRREELKRSYRPKKRPRREDTNVDQKLKRLKEQLLMELGPKDNSGPLLSTSWQLMMGWGIPESMY